MTHLEESFTNALVASVPDSGVQGAAVTQERRPGIDETNMVGRDPNRVAVPDHVATWIETVDAPVGADLFPVGDIGRIGVDPARFRGLKYGSKSEVDPVRLHLLGGDCTAVHAVECLCDEAAGSEHIRGSVAEDKTLPTDHRSIVPIVTRSFDKE
jgi:hypothetical protein